MLVVVISPAENEVLLCPDDEGDQRKSAGFQMLGKQMSRGGRMPHIGYISGEEFPGVRPVGAVIIEDFAFGKPACGFIHFLPPFGIVIDPIGRVGHHQNGDVVVQEFANVCGVGAVPAHEAMGAEQVNITELAPGFGGDCGKGLFFHHIEG